MRECKLTSITVGSSCGFISSWHEWIGLIVPYLEAELVLSYVMLHGVSVGEVSPITHIVSGLQVCVMKRKWTTVTFFILLVGLWQSLNTTRVVFLKLSILKNRRWVSMASNTTGKATLLSFLFPASWKEMWRKREKEGRIHKAETLRQKERGTPGRTIWEQKWSAQECGHNVFLEISMTTLIKYAIWPQDS